MKIVDEGELKRNHSILNYLVQTFQMFHYNTSPNAQKRTIVYIYGRIFLHQDIHMVYLKKLCSIYSCSYARFILNIMFFSFIVNTTNMTRILLLELTEKCKNDFNSE